MPPSTPIRRWRTATVVPNLLLTSVAALSTMKFCTEGNSTIKVMTIGQNIRNKSATDSVFNNIFVTLPIQESL